MTPHRSPRRIASTAASALLVAAGIILFPGPAMAADYSVDVGKYCAKNVSTGNYWTTSTATNINGRWDGWRCTTQWGLVSVDMQKACSQQVPGSRAVVVNTTWSGWRCRL